MSETETDTPRRKGALTAVIVLCLGGLAVAITQTVVIPIQSELPKILSTSSSNTSWVVTATLLAAAVSMPIAGRIADIIGKRRVLIVTAALLAVGSLVCAVSGTVIPVLIGRALQGFALGFIPVGIALVREITPPRMTPTAIAAMSATLGVGGAIGLPLAAAVAQAGGFPALFWMSTGVAIVLLIGVLLLVPKVGDAEGGRFDIVGAVGLAAGLVALLIAVSKGNEWGWGSPAVLALLIGGVAVLVLWGWFELRTHEPLVDLRTTARPIVLLTNVAGIAIGFGQLAQSVAIPQLLELPTGTGFGLGQTVLAAGLWMAPSGLMMLLFAPVSSALIRRIGAKWTLTIGASVVAIGYASALLLTGSPWELMIAACIASAGVAIGYAAMPTLILGDVPSRESGSAVGINSLMRSLGSSTAAAVMAMFLASVTVPYQGGAVPDLGAFQLCFLVAAAAAVVAIVVTALIPARHAVEPHPATGPIGRPASA
jgi:MFS family permease